MRDEPLSPDLAELEQVLLRRPLPVPLTALRLRTLGEVQRARARERQLLLATAAAVLLAVLGLGLSSPGAGDETRPGPTELARAQELELVRLGFDSAGARAAALLQRAGSPPRFAPPMGSGVAPLASVGGG